jgi:Spx/MgsR family transcriptional regulator
LIEIYGLRNCDTCRRARSWLEAQGIVHRFNDIRQAGLSREEIAKWAAEAGWERLLNRRGMTWRALPEDQKNDLDRDRAVDLMAGNPALVKRPVWLVGDTVLVGFNEDVRTFLAGS